VKIPEASVKPYSFTKAYGYITSLGDAENPLPLKVQDPDFLDKKKDDQPSFIRRLSNAYGASSNKGGVMPLEEVEVEMPDPPVEIKGLIKAEEEVPGYEESVYQAPPRTSNVVDGVKLVKPNLLIPTKADKFNNIASIKGSISGTEKTVLIKEQTPITHQVASIQPIEISKVESMQDNLQSFRPVQLE